MAMDSFCGSALWNETLLLDNTWPEFTQCFQETVLTIVPCGWLWLTSIIHIIYLHKHVQYIQLPTSCIYLAKLLFSFSLAFVEAVHLLVPIDKVAKDETVPPSVFVSRCVWIVSFIYAGIIQRLSQRSGIHAPCIVFIFWTISLVCHVIPAYSAIMLKSFESDVVDFGLIYLTLMMLLIQFILHCFGEKNYTMIRADPSTNPCRSVGASFASKLIFQWAFRMVYKGYKMTVQITDLSDLPPYMQCRNIVPEFVSVWKRETFKIRAWSEATKKQIHEEKMNNFVDEVESPTERTSLLSTQNQDRRMYNTTDVAFKAPKKKTLSLYKLLMKIYYLPLFKAQIVGLGADMLAFVNPLLLEKMINYAKNKAEYPQWHGFVIAGAFFCVVFLTSVMTNYRFYSSFNIGTKVKTSLIAAVYKKSLSMNSDSRQKFTVGTTVNLMAVDCPRFLDLTTSLWAVVSCPLQLAVGFYMLYYQLGISFIAGVVVLILLIPVNAKISNCAKNAQSAQIAHKDQRVKLMNEMLNGIRVLKLYAWESSFQRNIADIRQKEVYQLKRAAVFQAFNVLTWLISPILMTSATFIMFVLLSSDNTLTPTTAFVSLSIFNMIKQPMNSLPNLISSFIQCHVSMKRLRDYLSGDDLEGLDTSRASDEYPVAMYNGTFSWDQNMPPILNNMTAWIPRGKLVAVVGQVGAGKSSFLSALLGEMNRNSGWASIKFPSIPEMRYRDLICLSQTSANEKIHKLRCKGTIGYVPQQAWIQNKSLRDNILFGKEMNSKFYKKVIRSCALDPDIQLLPGGELTEIGEKGINLSGGQKQRISLARAVYQDSDVFLFDDPLSAVDAHVGKHIFDKVLGPRGIISEKTRVLVTHGIHWLPMVDSIMVIDKGCITEAGSYEELMGHNGPFAQFVKTYLIEHMDDEVDDPEVKKLQEQVKEKVENALSDEELPLLRRSCSPSECSRSIKSDLSLSNVSLNSDNIDQVLLQDKTERMELETLIQEEKSETGKVKKEVFGYLLRAFGYSSAVGVLVFLALYNGVNVGGSIWLSVWTSDPFLQNVSNKFDTDYTSKTEFYLGIYCAFNVIQVIGNAFFLLLLMVQFVNTAQRLHNGMLDNILHQNMAFFDTTPLGRILNRFSRDVDVMDTGFSRQSRICLQYLFSILSVVIVISYTSPLFLAVVAPIFTVYILFQKFYIPSSRQFRRLESISRSPIFSHFAETIIGANSIRSFKVTDRFFQDSLRLVDTNNKCFYANASAARWLRIRLEILGNLIVQFTALFAVLSNNTSASLVGLSITYALQVTNMLNILVQNATQLETNTVSVERIVEYTSLEREPLWVIRESRPPLNWPQQGRVEFCGYSTRYRPGLDLVLKAISFIVNPGEKIGIVGRTGAGKSSLSLSLFRVIEAAQGNILIDGVDISTLGLHDLRSRLTILPQDPVLFSGTLRFNLDPFTNHPDSAVWQALDNAHMGDFVRGMPGGLNFICEEGGQNLSVGQRQLVCLARSLLRKTKILVLDEATAAVDLETDHLLQETIREAFVDCTVLTVAHRLKTVIDYDRILVLSQGEIVEFDTPKALLDDETSVFHGMAKQSRLL